MNSFFKVVIAPFKREITSVSDLDLESFRPETPLDQLPEIIKDPKTLRMEKIEWLKKKDPVYKKRLEQFAIYKNIKKAPLFDEEKKVSDLNIATTIKNRDKRELMNIVEEHQNYRPNPYTKQQKQLNDAVRKFCQEQIKNTHIYEGKFKCLFQSST